VGYGPKFLRSLKLVFLPHDATQSTMMRR